MNTSTALPMPKCIVPTLRDRFQTGQMRSGIGRRVLAFLAGLACLLPIVGAAHLPVNQPCVLLSVICVDGVGEHGLITFSGTVTNCGDITLTNVVVVSDRPAPNTVVFTMAALDPGVTASFSVTYPVLTDDCAVAVTFTGSGQSIFTSSTVASSITTTCAVTSTPSIAVTQNCPTAPVIAGDLVLFSGMVSNNGNITLTNVFVFSNQPNPDAPVMGPITLAPGASAPFAGSYLATSGTDPMTNATIVTNSVSTITTNSAEVVTTNTTTTITTNSTPASFGTIDPVTEIMVNRFNIGPNFHGLVFADQDQNWGATLFYTTRQPETGSDQFVTISAAGAVTDRFELIVTNYNALTLAAPDVGHGEKNFYYLRDDGGSVSTFGVIKAAGASSSADLPPDLPGLGYNALTFAEANISGYGANLFYFLREETGLTTLGTISISGAMVVTDRYTVGLGMNYDSMVFVPGAVSTWGTDLLAYLRHDAIGSIIGTIDPVTQVVTDRFSLGTNVLSALAFTATDVGFGPNLFYYLLPERTDMTTNSVTSFSTNSVITMTTNTVTTFTTNTVVSFTPANTVTATGTDICQARTVIAAANCQGAVAVPPPVMIGVTAPGSGPFTMSMATELGQPYIIQYKNSLSDPTWTDLGTYIGTGGIMSTVDAASATEPMRFYRVIFTLQPQP